MERCHVVDRGRQQLQAVVQVGDGDVERRGDLDRGSVGDGDDPERAGPQRNGANGLGRQGLLRAVLGGEVDRRPHTEAAHLTDDSTRAEPLVETGQQVIAGLAGLFDDRISLVDVDDRVRRRGSERMASERVDIGEAGNRVPDVAAHGGEAEWGVPSGEQPCRPS